LNAIFSGPQLAYLLIALVVLGLAFAGIVWVGRMIRGELGSGAARGGDPAGLAMLEQVPPAMMKEAIARGLVVPSQLAGMTAMLAVSKVTSSALVRVWVAVTYALLPSNEVDNSDHASVNRFVKALLLPALNGLRRCAPRALRLAA